MFHVFYLLFVIYTGNQIYFPKCCKNFHDQEATFLIPLTSLGALPINIQYPRYWFFPFLWTLNPFKYHAYVLVYLEIVIIDKNYKILKLFHLLNRWPYGMLFREKNWFCFKILWFSSFQNLLPMLFILLFRQIPDIELTPFCHLQSLLIKCDVLCLNSLILFFVFCSFFFLLPVNVKLFIVFWSFVEQFYNHFIWMYYMFTI